MANEDGLICAYKFDGNGGGTELDRQSFLNNGNMPFTWVHLQLDDERAETWLREESGIPLIAAEALVYEETRPRCTAVSVSTPDKRPTSAWVIDCFRRRWRNSSGMGIWKSSSAKTEISYHD